MLCLIFYNVVTLGAASSLLSPIQRTVYYAGGFANHVTMKGNFEITRASFDEEGHLLSAENVTAFDAFMMGYVRVNPNRNRVIFSAQAKNKSSGHVSPHVLLYETLLPVAAAEPTLLLPDIGVLLAGCQKPFAPCNQADQFHPTFDYHAAADEVVTENVAFAFRAWTADGMPGGNQALALRTANNTVRLLTFNASDIHTMDGCPLFVPGTGGKQIIFQRNLMEGSIHTVAHLDVEKKEVTELSGLRFAPVDFGGCPAFVAPAPAPEGRQQAKEATFVFIGQNNTPNQQAYTTNSIDINSRRWGVADSSAASAGLGKVYMVAVTIAVGDRDSTTTRKGVVIDEKVLFELPLVNTTWAEDMLSLQFCSQVMQSQQRADMGSAPVNALTCKTADIKLAELNPITGVEKVNMTMPWPRFPDGTPIMWAMTPYSFQVWAD